MNLLIKILSIFVCLVVLSSCENATDHETSIEEEVGLINKNCPKMLDEETRLEKVVFTKPSLIIYNYSLVNLSRQNVDTAQFRTALWPGILSAIRVDKDLADLRERQMNFEYRYYDQSKELIYTFKISPANYQP